MCDSNNKEFYKQMRDSWKNKDFQSALKKNSEFLDSKIISEIDGLFREIKHFDFVVCQQNVVLLNYIYDDLMKGDFSEINQYLAEIKKNMSSLA